MNTPVIKSVKTQNVGFAPILRHYFEMSGIKDIIDEQVDLDPRRKTLTHGEAAIALVTGILFQVMQLYRICQFASEKNVLNVILPHMHLQTTLMTGSQTHLTPCTNLVLAIWSFWSLGK